MAGKGVDDSSTGNERSGDTIELEQQSIMETAEFKALVELGSELFGDEDPGITEVPAEGDGLLTITDQFEALRVTEEDDFGFDPYDSGDVK